MKISIQLTRLNQRDDVLKTLVQLIRRDQEIQRSVTEYGFLFEGLAPGEMAALQQRLTALRHRRYAAENRTIRILPEDNNVNELLKTSLALLRANDAIAQMLWQRGLIIEKLTHESAERLKSALEAAAAQVTLDVDSSRDEDEGRLKYVVSGQVLQADNTPLAESGYTVQAFDTLSDTNVVPLSRALPVRENGTYQITYTWQSTGGRNGPNLTVRLSDPAGEEVATAAKHPAERREQLDLTLPEANGASRLVRGQVTQRDQGTIAGARVIALQQNLTGSVQLGTARTDSNGNYQIRYKSTQPSDLVVELRTPNGEAAVTRSPLVVDAADDQIVNLVVDSEAYPPLSEFAQMAAKLTPLLQNIPADRLTSDSVSYLAGKTGVSPIRISEYIQAQRFAQSSEVPAEVYYGLFRTNLPINKPALVAQDDSLLRQAAIAAAAANVINPEFARATEGIDRAVATLNRELVDPIIQQPELPDGSASLGAFLDIAALTEAQKQTVVSHVQSQSKRGDRFWESLAEQETIDARALNSLQLTAQLGTLTLDNAPLMRTLFRQLQDQNGPGERPEPLRGLVNLTTDNWADLIQQHRNRNDQVIIPEAFRTTPEPVRTYAQTMSRIIEDAYPTPTLAARLTTNDLTEARVLSEFVAAHPDFEFRDRSITSYLRTQAVDLPEATQQTLKRVGRIFDLAPRFERHATLQPLLAEGIDSAYQIRTLGEERFRARFSDVIGEERAQQVYALAAQKTATATTLLSRYGTEFNRVGLSVIPRPDIAQLLEGLGLADPSIELIDFPTWESLFGSIDFCDCKHCNSVFSPAAYLVALLKFLRDRGALSPLFARRPDIGNIALTCDNTHITLPYIDLVLEVLETFLVDGSDTYQTEGEVAALRVHPEHINAEAYRILAEDLVYPWMLPFSLWTEEVRAYLQPLNVTRHQLMDHYHPLPAVARSTTDWLAIAIEHLGLTPQIRDILLDTSFDSTRWQGQSVAALRTVQRLLDTARLPFLELRQLLGTRFVNPDGALTIDYVVGEGDGAEVVCDLAQARIEALSADQLNRLQRFVRLRRALGWSTHELDAILQALGGDIDAPTLVALAFLKQLQAQLKTPLLIIASWLAALDTHAYLTDADEMARSLYASLFLNRTVGSAEELVPFELGALGSAAIDDHEAAILAALQIITAEELVLIRTRRLTTNTLNLENLSELHRVATLKRALKISVNDLLNLLELSGLNPFDATRLQEAVRLVELRDLLQAVHFTVDELVYLLLHRYDANSPFVPTDAQISLFLTELRNRLQRIQTDFTAVPDPTGEITAQMLGIVLPAADLPQAVALIYGVAAASELPADPTTFLATQLAYFIPDAATRDSLVGQLLDSSRADYLQPELQQTERFAGVLEPLASYLRSLNSITLVQQLFADFLEIELDASGSLLGSLIHAVTDPTQPASTLFLREAFINSSAPITATSFADQFAMVHRLYKAALLMQRLDLPTEELEWIVTSHATVGWLDWNDIPVALTATVDARWEHWLAMAEAARLRQVWPAGEPSLFALLRQAEVGGDAAAFEAFLTALRDRTGWSETDLSTLLDATHFALDDFNADWGGTATLQHLLRLQHCFGLLRALGVSAAMAGGWTQNPVTRTMAGEVKQAARAKYSETQWLTIAEPIRDTLRQQQRTTLVEATIQKIGDPEIQTSNDLYAFFLMDTEINPCLQTSRLVFATGGVQLFIQRILLNLEAAVSFSNEEAALWQWMKNYRVWEANVKVFITPENWIEPELRPEKSPFFIELENELLQNDITLETAELAYQNYLERLDEVARLEVVGVFNENDTHTLHVIARTKGTPHKFFYRQWYRARRWTPWQEVPLDIEADTVTPVIYNRRLYLFWLTTIEKAEEETQNEKRPNRYLEIKLAWSQYRQRKWAPKRLSAVVINTQKTRSDFKEQMLNPAGYRPRPVFRPNGYLFVAIERSSEDSGSSYFDSNKLEGSTGFLFIHDGQINLSTYKSPRQETVIQLPIKGGRSWSHYFRASGTQGLDVRGWDGTWQDVLDGLPFRYQVTVPLQYSQYNSAAPFFLEDERHIYFVTPRHLWGARPSYTGSLTVEFPHLNVYLEENIPLLIDDILEPIVPGAIDPAPIRPSLESVLYPETHRPDLGVVVSDTIASINRAVLPQPTLEVVSGGVPVTGGNVGIPIIGSSLITTGLTQFTQARILSLAQATALVDSNGELRADTITRSTNELVVANAVMGIGSATGIWNTWFNAYRRTEYTFHSFDHPYVDMLIKQLNRYGVEGMLDPREHGEAHDLRRQQVREQADAEFRDIYDLAEDINDSEDMLPAEEFDFEYGRAYSLYNWELFFHIPLMIANHLSQNQRFDEARQWYRYIFDPTDNSDLPAVQNRYRFWKIKPFFENTEIQTIEQLLRLLSSNRPADLEMKRRLEDQIDDWRENPFQPHLIAEQRPVAYQKAVVMKYMDNEIAHGDYLFRQDTMESVFEAIQHYLLVAEILGDRPERIPAPPGTRSIGGTPVQTFNDLVPHLDAFGNAIVQLETELVSTLARTVTPTLLAASSSAIDDDRPAAPLSFTAEPPVHEIVGSTLFFCIPPNAKLLGYWDTVADRLFKIRNCQNIEGVVRQLALFAPPIDPALLVRAAAAGIDLGSILNDLNAPRPHYRFRVMVQKALELGNDLTALGNALLSALEKRDAETLSLLRQTHEQTLLKAVKQVRKQQIDEAQETLAGLEKNRESAAARQQFYANRNPLIPNEKLHLTRMEAANLFDNIAQGIALIGSALALIPEFDLGAEGGFSSPTVKAQFGGANLSRVISFQSQLFGFLGSIERQGAQRAQTLATYDRRQEEWDFSAEQASIDSAALERQVVAAEIRLAIAEQELANQELQIEQSREIDELMRGKFTNRDLYSWMVTQISTLYFQSYQLAYDLAKRAEKAFQHELADYSAGFISFGYWDSLHKGLLAGDRLYLDLRRLEAAYYERHKRELELTKHISLLRLDPAALIQLRETGSCEVDIPEVLFNLDFPGHYLRRLKTVSLTIPGVVGPYTGINATLTLLSNRIRVSTVDPDVAYAGVDDPHFITNIGGIQAIALCNGREDSGLFELNLQDERFLPFEGAGAISRWRIELNNDYRAFDFDTISDVILHLRYTARDGGAAVRQVVVPALATHANAITNATADTGLYHFISLQREFGGELYRFLNPTGTADHSTTLRIRRDQFPYLFQGRSLNIQRIIVLLKLRNSALYDNSSPLAIALIGAGDNAQSADLLTATGAYGNLPTALYEHITGVLGEEQTWQLQVNAAAVQTLPADLRQTVLVGETEVFRLRSEQFEDIGILIHYTIS